MEEKFEFTLEERRELGEITQRLKALVADEISEEDEAKVRKQLEEEIDGNKIRRDVFGQNPILLSFQTAELEVNELRQYDRGGCGEDVRQERGADHPRLGAHS